MNFGRRFYDPRLGRWLTPDPEKFVDGMNLYAYVHNNPLTHFDDYGLLMSARDYETVRQIASAPWEEKRPWEALSTFGRFLGAKAAYEMHNTFLTPLTRDIHRGANALFPNSFPEHRTESRIHEEQSRIMSVFGMDTASSNWIRNGDTTTPRFVEGYIPFGPGALSTLSKVRQVGTKIFANSSALSPIRKFINKKKFGRPIKNQKILLNFTNTAARHMYEIERRIPVHILDDMIKLPVAVAKDPQGASNAFMHYSQIWKNGKLYNAEVLYDKATNTILHFQYTQKPLGPLKKFLNSMYKKTDKRRIYQLIDMYLSDKINESTFCYEFYCSYDLELDYNTLTEDEYKLFYELSEIASRFSELEEDIKNYPGIYYSKEELRDKIIETKKNLKNII